MEKLFEGAESIIYQHSKTKLIKQRIKKDYRITQLDESLRKQRTKREFKILKRLKENNLNVPSVNNLEKFQFELSYLDNPTLKEHLTKSLLDKAFNQIIKMHSIDITHGDLTTLNMLNHNNKVYLIDFGLGEFTNKKELKAIDLHLFFTCIKNEHPKFYKHKKTLINKYPNKEIIKRLEKIEKRGRNK